MCNDQGDICGSAHCCVLSIETNLFVFVVSSSSGSKVLLDLTDREKYVGYFSFDFFPKEPLCLFTVSNYCRIRFHALITCQQQT